jgi:hypothetical protein
MHSTLKTNLVMALIALAGVSSAWSQQAVSYKGVSLGASLQEFKEKLPDFSCSSSGICDYSYKSCTLLGGAAEACRTRTSFGGATVQGGTARFRDGKLAYLGFRIDSREVGALIEVLRERLDAPTRLSEEPAITRAGVTVPNIEAVWERAELRVSARKHGLQIGEGIVTVMTPEELEAMRADRAAKVKQGAKDL